MNELDERLIRVIPSARQLALQDLEFYAFIHFTVNTFTDREWGDGTESPEIFNPVHLDADQWAKSIRAAGMRGMILTCKHHDGFCLWPSHYTDHTVAASPYREGKGDVVAEAARACRENGLEFGVYLSPWDRNQPLYGTGKPYDDYFVAQLTELLSNYGRIFSVWFDGACGEGPNGKKQYYDWERYYQVIRTLQPDACIHVCGPDIRWCGNEAGDTRESEWSVVPRRTMDTEKIASVSQQADDDSFRLRTIRAGDRDLGSRQILEHEPDLIWYPAEVNTSIRPGWFWHASEDDQVRTLEKLIDIYEKSVGGNATLLLNIPPTREGLLHPNDVRRLEEFGQYLKESYSENLIMKASRIMATPSVWGHEITSVSRDDETYYMPLDQEEAPWIEVEFPELTAIRRIVIKEQLTMSQRVERFCIDVRQEESWTTVHTGTVIGHKRIVVLSGTAVKSIRIRITDCRSVPAISYLGLYR